MSQRVRDWRIAMWEDILYSARETEKTIKEKMGSRREEESLLKGIQGQIIVIRERIDKIERGLV